MGGDHRHLGGGSPTFGGGITDILKKKLFIIK